jgi:hypothetical protein
VDVSNPRLVWKPLRIQSLALLSFGIAAFVTVLPPLVDLRLGLPIYFGLGWLGAVFWREVYRCPRCSNPFFRKGPWQYLLTDHCVHCGQQAYKPLESLPSRTSSDSPRPTPRSPAVP